MMHQQFNIQQLYALPTLYLFLFLFPVALWSNGGYGLLILAVSRSHTTTHHSRLGSFGRVISESQRPQTENNKYTQQKNIHASGGIRTHNLNRRKAVDLRLRPRVPCDHIFSMIKYIYIYIC